jgi:hypothetical protein
MVTVRPISKDSDKVEGDIPAANDVNDFGWNSVIGQV